MMHNAKSPSKDRKPIAVIGAGIIGASIAFSLQKRGFQTLLLDRDAPGRGASYGNMSSIAVTEFMPVSRPGTWARLPRWLLDSEGPIRIRPSYLPRLAPWFLRFLRAGFPRRVVELEDAGATLTGRVYEDLLPLLEDVGLSHLLSETGCLSLYANDMELAADREHIELFKRYGFDHHLLDRRDLLDLEPAISEHIQHAILLPQAKTIKDPYLLTIGLVERFEALGGITRRSEVLDFGFGRDGIKSLIATGGESIPVSDVVVCCGAHTRNLSLLLGDPIPLETERGYHTQLTAPGIKLGHALIIPAKAFMITPVANGIRIGGTIELAGLTAPPDYRRSRILVKHASTILENLQTEERSDWMGHRPALPDTIPVIGRSAKLRNCYYATGHGHLGVTLAATTARLIADLITAQPTPIDLTPYRVDRF